MNKENKGLTDNQDGDFILNESGTSVSIGLNENEKPDTKTQSGESESDEKKLSLNDDPVAANDRDSDRNAAIGEGEIKAYNDVFPNHPAFEDIDEIQSTDDV